jgi:hypothetical protein
MGKNENIKREEMGKTQKMDLEMKEKILPLFLTDGTIDQKNN